VSATSWLEMLTRSAMKRRYLCPFVSTLVPVGTGVDNRGQEWTGVDKLGPVWGSRREAGAWPAIG